jgi:hypothetical protein
MSEVESIRGLLIDPFKHEILPIQLVDPDADLLRKVLRCDAVAQYIIYQGEDGFQWQLNCDQDSLAKLDTCPQWSFVPAAEFLQQLIPNPDHRIWIQGYGIVTGFKDGHECSLPENVWAMSFREAVKCCWTDWRADGIGEDIPALLMNWELEFPGRLSICGPRGAIRVPGGMPPLLP